jgi:predicted Zn-dependent protease
VLATEQDDRRAGEESTRDIIGEFGLLSNPVLQAYVQAVGERVARHATGGFTYHFQVIQPWIPNALALPGGAIFVSRGIVALSSSEDELAGVLAHEVTHVARRHASAQQQIISMTPFAFGIYGYAQIAAYARDQEREADRGGQQLLAAAGYDPRAMASMLRKLDQVDRLQLGAPQLPSFLTTHPSPTERTATAYALAQQLVWTHQPGIARDDDDFLHRLEGLVAGADPSEGVFVANRFLHPDLDFGVSFPEGWTLVNSPTMVAAYPPERVARFALESAGPGDDPKVAAGRFLAVEAPENHTQIVDARSIEIDGRPAFEVRAWGPTPQGAMAGQLTWIAYNGSVYRFSAAAPGAYAELFFGRARIMSRSFRPLTPAERESIRVERIAIARAREGENIETLSKRAGNAWDATETAIWNGLIPDSQLEAGEPVKISHSEIYLTAKETAPGTAGPAAAVPQPAGQPSR